MKEILLIIAGLLVGIGIGYYGNWSQPEAGGAVDVKTMHDTITDNRPMSASVNAPQTSVRARLKTSDRRRDTLPEKGDRCVMSDDQPEEEEAAEPCDSVEVEVPITQKVYTGRNYRAYVSGYCQSLDSISIYTESKVITQLAGKPKAKRWHLGVTAGYGYTPEGFQPYVGIGVTYSLFGF